MERWRRCAADCDVPDPEPGSSDGLYTVECKDSDIIVIVLAKAGY